MLIFGLTSIQIALCIVSGVLVGFILGIISGGGSIIGIPLLIYLVGYNHPHIVIGTTALAVGTNALLNLIPHLRKKNGNIKIGLFFGGLGVIGVLIGNELGLLTPGKDLLFLLGILIIGVSINMLREKVGNLGERSQIKKSNFKLAVYALGVGFIAGYFGIGAGFLILPAMIASAGLDILQAVGTALIPVGFFAFTTAIRYTISGDLNPFISFLYIIGGIVGGWIGTHYAHSVSKSNLKKIYAIVTIPIGIYILYMNITAFI